MSKFACFVLTNVLLSFCLQTDEKLRASEPDAGMFTSDNFVVTTSHASPLAGKVSKLCESLRSELMDQWGGESQPGWDPKCEVNVHSNRQSYLSAVGKMGGSTLGSSLLQFDSGQVSLRRIDLLIDSLGELQALPHELTHVVLADRFGSQPPHWFDEGAAMIADTPHKRSLHQRDCREALQNGNALPLDILFHLEQFTSAEQMSAFYGQSESLIRFFCQRGDLDKVATLNSDAKRHGYDAALRKHYQIDGVGELERLWKAFAYNKDSGQGNAAILAVGYRP